MAAPDIHRSTPWNIGRVLIWTLFAVVLVIAPLVFRSSLALTMLSQMGYLIIICLSYNMLLGQGGMLSFGHAVYTGLGSFVAVHAMNLATRGAAPLPVIVIPLVGGLAGMLFAVLFGFCIGFFFVKIVLHFRLHSFSCELFIVQAIPVQNKFFVIL